ncbi:hypothetical protein RSOLAG1IB_11295 [Rhizoctonia solani AG-1 IB]|uniref:Uncharacterized protein n=1 Tax=Thanatephorus cucumeris (strain AG1-IB / isolate 7/3/14) TaxID=1108050 RepID=A0A0B7FAE2_THACB|nr:hypothetical protein RSOLAG1IB_11295 [Rhizoctonia solani AG-1 IB]
MVFGTNPLKFDPEVPNKGICFIDSFHAPDPVDTNHISLLDPYELVQYADITSNTIQCAYTWFRAFQKGFSHKYSQADWEEAEDCTRPFLCSLGAKTALLAVYCHELWIDTTKKSWDVYRTHQQVIHSLFLEGLCVVRRFITADWSSIIDAGGRNRVLGSYSLLLGSVHSLRFTLTEIQSIKHSATVWSQKLTYLLGIQDFLHVSNDTIYLLLKGLAAWRRNTTSLLEDLDKQREDTWSSCPTWESGEDKIPLLLEESKLKVDHRFNVASPVRKWLGIYDNFLQRYLRELPPPSIVLNGNMTICSDPNGSPVVILPAELKEDDTGLNRQPTVQLIGPDNSQISVQQEAEGSAASSRAQSDINTEDVQALLANENARTSDEEQRELSQQGEGSTGDAHGKGPLVDLDEAGAESLGRTAVS